jgi:uncharacterized cupin superfamily protein
MARTEDTIPAPVIPGPVAADGIAWEEWHEGTRFGSRARHLTSAAVGEGYHVGVLMEELAPGKQSAPFHYHMVEEEHLYVLEGSATLRLGDDRHELKAGDYVCFPAGQQAGHCLVNEGSAPCRFLVIGEKRPDEVCVYPDSGKVSVRSLREIYDRSAIRRYWDGEPTDG